MKVPGVTSPTDKASMALAQDTLIFNQCLSFSQLPLVTQFTFAAQGTTRNRSFLKSPCSALAFGHL